MGHMRQGPSREDRYRSLFAQVYPDLVRFVQRRVRPEQVDDVVSETLLVWWRRFDEAPRRAADARAWLMGVARQVMLNQWRGDRRRAALAVRIAAGGDAVASSPEEAVASRVDLARAWESLDTTHQEVLGLAVFEDLTSAQAGAVLGIGATGFRVRLTRARRALKTQMDLAASSAVVSVDEERVIS